jgi:chromate transporter
MTSTPAVSLTALATYFLRIGVIGFGGPPAHLALMRTELVERRGWLTTAQFDADLATANLLPGPTSTEMAIYVGLRLHGTAGALLAGSCFILPAAVMVCALAWAYVTWGTLDWMQSLLYGVKPVAFALVLYGILQMQRSIRWTPYATAIGLAALAALLLTSIDVLTLFLIAGAAAALRSRTVTGMSLVFPASAYANTAALASTLSLAAILWEFLKIGAVIYGGGFALIGILQQTFVEQLGWLTQRQLLDAIAVGQSTPGPVFTTATFLGYLFAGTPGAIVATIGIFAPAFLFVRLEQLLLGRLRQSAVFMQFLQGVNLAVLAALIHSSIALGRDALSDPFAALLCGAAFIALAWKKIDAHWLVGVGLVVGLIRLAIS